MGLYPRNARLANWLQGDGLKGAPKVRLVQLALYHEHPALGSSIVPHATVTLTTPTVLATDTVFAAQPDVPRNIILTGNTGATEAIIVNGLDAGGNAIHEDFTLSGATPQVGAVAFASFTSFVYSAGTHTCSFCCGDVLGIGHKLTYDTEILQHNFDGTNDAGTSVVNATTLSLNTYAPAGTPDGVHKVDILYYIRPTA